MKVSKMEAFCYDRLMKLNATLCTTNANEPWAANVDFMLTDGLFITKLNVNYAHYKNLVVNKNVVIVYKTALLEILIKGIGKFTEYKGDNVTVSIKPTWLRLVENDDMNDASEPQDIQAILEQKITL